MKKQLLFTTLAMMALGGYLHATQDEPKDPESDAKKEVTEKDTRHAAATVVVAESDKDHKTDDVSKRKEKGDQK